MYSFALGSILGKGFPQAQVHTVHSLSAELDNWVEWYINKKLCFLLVHNSWKTEIRFFFQSLSHIDFYLKPRSLIKRVYSLYLVPLLPQQICTYIQFEGYQACNTCSECIRRHFTSWDFHAPFALPWCSLLFSILFKILSLHIHYTESLMQYFCYFWLRVWGDLVQEITLLLWLETFLKAFIEYPKSTGFNTIQSVK